MSRVEDDVADVHLDGGFDVGVRDAGQDVFPERFGTDPSWASWTLKTQRIWTAKEVIEGEAMSDRQRILELGAPDRDSEDDGHT